LRRYRSFELGAMAIRGAIAKAGVLPEAIGEVIGGSCRQAGNGLNPVRTAALLAGLPSFVPAETLNMACPSGMKAIALAAQAISSSCSDVVLACGMDSMSTIPHLVRGLRFDTPKLGDLAIEDGWKDATDPYTGLSMGETAEHLARSTGISRLEQDSYALESHRRTVAAWESGAFSAEVLPKADKPLLRDEVPRPDTNGEKLAALPPAFRKDGTITAGNACAMADGAAALVMTSASRAKELGLTPLASLVSFAQTAVSGQEMSRGPELSIPMALQRADLRLADIDLVEINEAFAVQVIANARALRLDPGRLNVHGGAIALGHPTGVSGARIVVTLIHALQRRNANLGLAAICGGGGVTTAMVLRRES
jgi:acetyl-CoA C-acetyltransferase